MVNAEIEILRMSLAPRSALLEGAHLDRPRSGQRIDGHRIELLGWALGHDRPVVAIEVVHAGNIVRRAPITLKRPDIAVAYPHVPDAERSGFRTIVTLAGLGEWEMTARAVLDNQERADLATILVQRRWHHDEDPSTTTALVSVVIPCFNQAHYLGEAIESVLGQTHPHVEVVVIDDGSVDNAVAVAERYPGVRCIQQDNQGLAAARNTGLRHSVGDFLVFLDADDRLLPQAIETNLRQLAVSPECAFVAGHYREISYDGVAAPVGPSPASAACLEQDPYLALLRQNFITVPGSVLYRRSVFRAARGFDPAVSPAADYDLYLRIASEFPIACHDEVVVEYRRHGANMSLNAAAMLAATVAVLRGQGRQARRDAQYRQAYEEGLERFRQHYGAALIQEVEAHLAAHEWASAIRCLRALDQYYGPDRD